MQDIIQHNDIIFSMVVAMTISVALTLWFSKIKQRHSNSLLTREHHNQLALLQQQLTQVNDKHHQLEQELQQLDNERDQVDYQSRQYYGQLMAASEKLNYLDSIQQELIITKQQLEQSKQTNAELNGLLREQQARQQELMRAAEEKLELLQQSEARLKQQFKTLANQVFDNKVKSVDEQNKLSLQSLLTPLKEQLDGFKQQVNNNFTIEAKERHTLVHEIRNLQKLNAQMAQDAINLTQALKGDNKQQGNWGEVVLARVLSDSGLREGYEYQTQVSLQNEAGKRYQPDVIVNLPEDKQVIVDSKMVLVAFERYYNSEDAEQKQKALTEHIIAIRNHFKQLSQKDYHQLKGVTSLDYVLMFIPIELAFQLAIEADPSLIKDAMEQNIIIVSPTTLLVALRTINNLWRNERQNQNAKHIAERASKLYDKLRLFVDDMQNLGGSLDKAHSSYQAAMNKLVSGKGNLIRQAESFKQLGVVVKKSIDNELVEIAQNDSTPQRLSTEDTVN